MRNMSPAYRLTRPEAQEGCSLKEAQCSPVAWPIRLQHVFVMQSGSRNDSDINYANIDDNNDT